ncbi:hypothetical protein PABG_01855 [Paracoccidioides brasiliensis Pb03]|nr:hypothetical protein PABG_01855 [Paracoccidioides brasiliensis Pb03]
MMISRPSSIVEEAKTTIRQQNMAFSIVVTWDKEARTKGQNQFPRKSGQGKDQPFPRLPKNREWEQKEIIVTGANITLRAHRDFSSLNVQTVSRRPDVD